MSSSCCWGKKTKTKTVRPPSLTHPGLWKLWGVGSASEIGSCFEGKQAGLQTSLSGVCWGPWWLLGCLTAVTTLTQELLPDYLHQKLWRPARFHWNSTEGFPTSVWQGETVQNQVSEPDGDQSGTKHLKAKAHNEASLGLIEWVSRAAVSLCKRDDVKEEYSFWPGLTNAIV